ncbi:MAG TPA: hypothetical protein VFB67_01595 [Candidatus Polarisedimenticolaceae bacterium]|nr:hypothetical protein [Candidatus Polarisedimenticolaceae bacterium]
MSLTCESARERIHAALDAPDDDRPGDVSAHLASCAACRELLDDLETVGGALRALPRVPLPPATLDAVWRETVGRRRWSPGLVRAAAAAVIVTALCTTTIWLVTPRGPQQPTAAEIARASAEAKMVLGYTARALAAARTAAADTVLASKVSPAVRGEPAARPTRRTR